MNISLFSGGGGSGSPVYKDDAELYDGAAWANTIVPDIRYKSGGAGTLSSGYMIHGSNSSGVSSSVRLWNGVAWSDGPGFGDGKTNENVGIGTTSATMAVGGATVWIRLTIMMILLGVLDLRCHKEDREVQAVEQQDMD